MYKIQINWNISYTGSWNTKLYSYFKTVHQLLKKLNRNSAPQAAISGSLPMEMKTCPQKDMYTHIYQQTGGMRIGGREKGPEEMGANENS